MFEVFDFENLCFDKAYRTLMERTSVQLTSNLDVVSGDRLHELRFIDKSGNVCVVNSPDLDRVVTMGLLRVLSVECELKA